ncbi:MAG: tetratricopeptide repeat protein [Nitrospirota bacterium]
MKRLFLQIFFCMLLIPSVSLGGDLYEDQLDKGIRNSEAYSYLLIKQSRANSAEAKDILKKALRYSPDLPAVYFELSKVSFTFSPEGMFEALDYMLQGISVYKRNFWWSFTMAGSLFTSAILSLIISTIIIILIRLPNDMSLLLHEIKEEKNRVLLFLTLVSAIIGPFFLIGGLLIIIGLYMKKWDRVFVYFFLLFLLILPWIFNAASMFFNASASGKLKAVVQVNESKNNKYVLSLPRSSSDPVELFSYALALKREGRYSEAIGIYDELITKRPNPRNADINDVPRLYNNLANCYVGINDIEKAKELYIKSIELKPLPSALYNLSQVLRETLDFDKGEEYFLSAQRLDRDAVVRFRAIFSRNPNRFVVDEVITASELWKYSMRKTTTTSTMGLSTVPIAFLPVIAFSMVILFYMLNRRLKNRAYRCSKCGTILCNRCEKHILWGRMCLQCYRSLVKLDELDAKKRIARVLTVYEYQKKRRGIIKVLSFIMPGSGQIYAGNVLYGLLFLWPFLFLLLILITNSIFVIETSNFLHIWLNWCSLFLMAVVYLLSNIITRRRLAKGWL